MAKTYTKHFVLKDSAVECTRFISNMFDGFKLVGLSKQPTRCLWMRWNLVNKDMDPFRSPSELKYCESERRKSEVREAIRMLWHFGNFKPTFTSVSS